MNWVLSLTKIFFGRGVGVGGVPPFKNIAQTIRGPVGKFPEKLLRSSDRQTDIILLCIIDI